MVLVNAVTDTEYFNNNPDYPCYADIVTSPHDILLQVQLGTGTGGYYTMTINVFKPDGTFLEDATSYFDVVWFEIPINTTFYRFANIRCFRYSPEMINNKCFILEITNPLAGGGVYHKYTQKYQLINASIYPDMVSVMTGGGTNLASLCSAANTDGVCNPLIKITSLFDCIDTFNGDYYGDAIEGFYSISGSGEFFPFVRFSWIQAMIRKLPTNIKRTVSINCRTQRTERTNKYLLSGFVGFPLWKVEEIDGMMLANHLFIGVINKSGILETKEYQSEGGTPFEQLGKPKNCIYEYKLGMELQDCFEWQTFGCTPPCTPLISYYPIAF